MPTLTEVQKLDLWRAVRAKMDRWYANFARKCPATEPAGPIDCYCLLWAHFTAEELRELPGWERAQLQAGSAFHPVNTQADDDGVTPNRYGYQFEWSPRMMFDVVQGIPPEWHCWAACPPTTIVDLTLPAFKRRAGLAGLKWTAPDPPIVYVCEGAELGWCVECRADPRAIKLAYALLGTLSGGPLVIQVH